MVNKFDIFLLTIAAALTTIASLTFLVVGVVNLWHDQLLSAVSLLAGVLLGSFVPDYLKMLREYL